MRDSHRGSLSIPVFRPNVASRVAGDATTVDDDAEEHEAEACDDLEQTQGELDLFPLARPVRELGQTHLAITPHAKDLDSHESAQQRDDPGAIVDTLRSRPVVDDVARGGDLERKDGQPADGILPAAGETPRGIHEAADVHGEGTVHRVEDGHFCERLHHEVTRQRGLDNEGQGFRHRRIRYIMPPGLRLVTTSRFHSQGRRTNNHEA